MRRALPQSPEPPPPRNSQEESDADSRAEDRRGHPRIAAGAKVETLFRLAKAAEQRDKVTGMHLVRMAKYSSLIAKGVGLSSAEQDAIELAAPMHDIGKIGIPDRILQNPGRLDGEDLRINAVPCAHRLRHAEGQLFRIFANGRSDRARPSREVRRQRLPDRLEGRAYPA